MLLAAAALVGFISVAFGAYAEHGLRQTVSEEMFRFLMTGVRYNQVHAVAALAVGLALLCRIEAQRALLAIAGWGFLVGVALFSGGIYLAALFDDRAFTMLTPIGGVTFLASWLCLFVAGVDAAMAERRRRRAAGAASGVVEG